MSTVDIAIVKITPELYDETEQLFIHNFLKYENLAKACRTYDNEKARQEMSIMLHAILVDGVSFAVRDNITGKLVSICINKLIVKTDDLWENICAQFTTENLKYVLEALNRIEINIFEILNVDCVFDLCFIATDEPFKGKGFAANLMQHSIDFARKMYQHELDNSDLLAMPEHLRVLTPKAVISTFSSTFSQKLSQRFGFQTINKVLYTDLYYKDETFAERIANPIHDSAVFAAIKF